MTPVHVDISNVATWFYEDSAQSTYDIAIDFPSVLCPWEHAIFTFQDPPRINMGGKLEKRTPPFLPLSVEVRTGEAGNEDKRAYAERFGEWLTEAVYFQTLELLVTYRGVQQTNQFMLMALDAEGRSGRNVVKAPPRNDGDIVDSYFYPVFYAISLLHCRNVEVRDRPVSRQQRRMAERTGKPAITYKELVIDAFRKQVRYESGQSGDNQIKRALHICRGHFATYGEHNPLFGRLTGTFWRPMHVRGNKDAGEVHKTYKVKGEK